MKESCTLTWHVPTSRRGRFDALSCRFLHDQHEAILREILRPPGGSMGYFDVRC
jgi:hypothetical protein